MEEVDVLKYNHDMTRRKTIMAKTLKTVVKLQIPGGRATPAPPIGPALGQAGVNIQQFCTQFNDRTKDMAGSIVPVVISVFDDKSFTFITKTPPASDLLRQAAGIQKGAGVPNKEVAGTITREQLKQIAEKKMPDLNANDIEAAMKIIEGSARQMGIKVKD